MHQTLRNTFFHDRPSPRTVQASRKAQHSKGLVTERRTTEAPVSSYWFLNGWSANMAA
jgi:hypothetical protein